MKTAVWLPDHVFRDAERLARRTMRWRSRLYCDALREYLARHARGEVTDATDRVCDELGHVADPFASSAALRILERSK